jgi:cytoskeletal protein CcmA (bactofilin family)
MYLFKGGCIMFSSKKKEVTSKKVFDTLIGTNTTIEGNIDSGGTVRIDGKVNGDLNVEGDVYIGREAFVTGNIHAASIHLSGTVQGNIHATNLLRLLSTAKLYGDIQVQSFVADEGAVFQGNCSMINTPAIENNSKTKIKNERDYDKSAVLDEAAK